jgi:hypothetical protein
MGNISGEYVEISGQSLENLTLLPLTIALPPAATFTVIPELTFKATPFFNIIYSITDDLSLNRNTPGTNFSRSGSLQVTSIKYVVTPAAATLTDMSSEINDTPYTITFMAEYDVTETDIEIKYTHDFPDDLTFSSSSLVWVQS